MPMLWVMDIIEFDDYGCGISIMSVFDQLEDRITSCWDEFIAKSSSVS
jgi:hypothetical protein